MWRNALGLSVLLLMFEAGVSQASKGVANVYPSPPGKLVNVGGYRLHLNCKGLGAPTVVMESGAGDFSFDWSLVQPELTRFARVCTYDRAGYAWSDPGPKPRTMLQIATELHSLLHNAGEKQPYILVGHSLGGLIVRVYAREYPQEVVGMVLVASSHEDNQIMLNNKLVPLRDLSGGRPIPPVQFKSEKAKHPADAQNPLAAPSKLDAPYSKLPEQVQQIRLWAMAQPDYAEARPSEFDYLPEETILMHLERAKSEFPLGDMPLIVITPGKGASEAYKKLQADLVRLSRSGKQIVAQNSEHHVQLDEPEVVVDAITQVVMQVARH